MGGHIPGIESSLYYHIDVGQAYALYLYRPSIPTAFYREKAYIRQLTINLLLHIQFPASTIAFHSFRKAFMVLLIRLLVPLLPIASNQSSI